jgi:hypothetical protein
MRILATASSLLWFACATTAAPPSQPQSARAHLEEAEAHDRDAVTHEHAAIEQRARGLDSVACGDRALSDQTTSGGEPVTRWVPCWSTGNEAASAHEQAAERLRDEARQHRATARALVEVERTFCAILAEDELTHTPLYHRHDILAVERYEEDGKLLGARIVWRPVEGLTSDYLRQALLCHRARMATLGYPTTYMPYDPSMLAATHIAIGPRAGQLVLTVRADDDVTAAVVWSRAQALIPSAR